MRSFDALLALARGASDPSSRRLRLRLRLEDGDPRVVVHWLGQLTRRAVVDDRAREAQLAIMDAWLEVDPVRVGEVRAAAHLSGDRLAEALLVDAPPEVAPSPRARLAKLGRYQHMPTSLEVWEYDDPERASIWSLSRQEADEYTLLMNLGTLIHQLRHPSREHFESIVRVHPRIEVSEIVQLANTRPLIPELQRRVLWFTRFRLYAQVQRALVANPTASTPLRLALLPLVPREWKQQARKGRRPVAQLARMLLELRRAFALPPPEWEPRPPERTQIVNLNTTDFEGPTTIVDDRPPISSA
jgi:hypothetical protein